MFYVESWLFVHNLFDTRQVTKANQYFTLVNDKQMSIPDAAKAAFGLTVDQLNDALMKYLRGDHIQVTRYTFDHRVVESTKAKVRPLDSLEVRTILADLHLHEPDYQAQATRELDAIVAEDPTRADSQRALGYAYLRDRNLTKAAEHLQAAAHLGSTDPRVYFFTAELINDKDHSALGSPEVQKNLRRAIELDPQYADAFGMLGISLMNSGNYAEAESILTRAIALSPRNEGYRLDCAFAQLNQKKIAEAKASIAQVVNSANPEIASQAAQLLHQANEYEEWSRKSASADQHVVARPADRSDSSVDSEPAPSAPVGPTRVLFVKGTLLSVDCSAPPAAVLTVSGGKNTWKLRVANTVKLVLIGADKFSCDWSHKKVALNISPTSDDEGTVISLEVQ